MAAPHQNIADIAVLKAAAVAPDVGDLNLDSEAPVGLKLAALRKAKGLTHAEVHTGTKIKVVHIAAIEAGDKETLPATPFAAGFVKAYAQFLGLDADAYARAYKREAGFVPLAAPVQAAIVREVMQAKAAAAPPAAATIASTALVLVPAPPAMRATEAPAPAAPARTLDADKMVTWLGAGAAIAVIAFIAGRAAQPHAVTSEISPASTVVAEPAAPEPVAAEPPAPAVEIAPQAAEPVEAPLAVAAVKPPVIKPKPKKRIVQDIPPAPVEVTPAPVLIAAPAVEAPAEPAPEPEPAIVAARMTRGAVAVYPERCATRAGEKVGVSVIFSITADGKPTSASVASTDNRCFNSAALRAVYDMRFSPRTIDGAAAIETGKVVTVQFVR